MRHILLLDTSADASTVAICNDGNIVSQKVNVESRNHASAINTMIDDACADAGILVSALDGVAVCSGPGSYTGVRIAMATAKGICYASNIPMMAHDRLFLMSLKERENRQELNASILMARQGEYYVGVYNEKMEVIVPPSHVFEADLPNIFENKNKLHITTDADKDTFVKLKVNFLSFSSNIILNYHTWASYAFTQFELQQFCNIGVISPLYIKDVFIHK